MQLFGTNIKSEANLDSSGNYTLVKSFIFELDTNDYVGTGDNYRISDSAPITLRDTAGFPQAGAALSENARYYMTGDVTVNLTAAEDSSIQDPYKAIEGQKRYYRVDAKYQLATFTNDGIDLDGDEINEDTPPWKLPPSNFTVSYPEYTVPFTLAYNEKGERKIRVANKANCQLIADTIEHMMQIDFDYSVENFKAKTGFDYSGSVNKDAITIAGITFGEGAAFIKPLSYQFIRTYDNSGDIKWEYYKIHVTILYKQEGWDKEILNIGTLALFDSSTTPEQIYQYRAAQETSATGTVTYTNAAGIAAEIKRLESKGKTLGYDMVTEPLPLTTAGAIDNSAITTPYDSDGNTNYVKLTFQEFKHLSWKALNLPKKR